jgi:organic radical activating enzyme
LHPRRRAAADYFVKKSDMLKLVDLFYSIQGEGVHTGVPSIFIRLHGCNLSCAFCDEPLHKGAYETFDFEAILERLKAYPAKRVVITGGEPSLYDLNGFIAFLQEQGYFVAVETNGYHFSNIQKANWVTYSPKDWDSIAKEGFDEIKFVVAIGAAVEKILRFHSDKPMFIQPQNDTDTPDMQNVRFCLDFVKAHPQFIFSAQWHKFLGVE